MDNLITNQLLILKIENAQDLPLPSRKTDRSAGLDLYANITKDILFYPGDIKSISAGIKLIIPKGYEIQIRPRSGLASEHGITVLNSPGTIDEDYRGEIKVILFNAGQSIFKLSRENRIAQMIMSPIIYSEPIEIDKAVFDSSQTKRGENGFGSTGV